MLPFLSFINLTYFCVEPKTILSMSKTLLESLNSIVETLKGGSEELDECVCFDPDDLSLFEEDTKPLSEALGLTPMQLVLLAG